MNSPALLHLDLDEAWPHDQVLRLLPQTSYLDCRHWGPALRFTAPRRAIEAFYEEVRSQLAPFILYGSGDFHHLTALWLRSQTEPFTLVSFDNHPDWDTRPPHWCCGSWLSRALERPTVRAATIWGPGNFELEWPNRLFANQKGIREGRLAVRPWAERLKPSSRGRWDCVTRENWRERFAVFADSLAGERIYVTVDMDCLASEHAATNWENGLFTAGDIAWALAQLHRCGSIIGGDVCGAYSPPRYTRFFQRLASAFDHPHLDAGAAEKAADRNLASLAVIWPALTPGAEVSSSRPAGFQR
jgi:arginase family enzyme